MSNRDYCTRRDNVAKELELVNLRAGYGKLEIIRGISVNILRGQVVSIIGPNGAGKSTLLKVIAGLLAPLSGQVYLRGEDISALRPHERVGEGVAYLMQGGRVFPSLSVRENLEMGSLNIPTRQRNAVISEVVDIFPALKPFSGKWAGLLSGGERQTLALAMLLVKRPSLLLLDEPSAGLSPKLVRHILDKVAEIHKVSGITVLLAEQNVKEALAFAHRVIALRNGIIWGETASPQEWLSNNQLEELFLLEGISNGAM